MNARTWRRVIVVAAALGISSALSATLAAAGNSKHRHGDRTQGSGEVVSRTLEVKDFDRIDVQGVADVQVRFGKAYSAELEAEDNLIDLIEVRVEGRTLVVETDEHEDFETDEGMHLRLVMPALVGVVVHGVSNVEIEGMDAESVGFELAGVGNIEARGRAKRIEVELEGVGKIDLRDLEVEDAEVDAGGVGEVLVNVHGVLDARVNGMSKVRYYGDPREVRDDVDGFGRLVQATGSAHRR
jgi:hypothetical protein